MLETHWTFLPEYDVWVSPYGTRAVEAQIVRKLAIKLLNQQLERPADATLPDYRHAISAVLQAWPEVDGSMWRRAS